MIIDESKHSVVNTNQSIEGIESTEKKEWAVIPLNKDSCNYIREGDLIIITNDGKKIVDVKTGKEFKQFLNNNGYYTVSIHNNHVLVHRLVALAWIGQPNADATIVNHKDGNKTNNHVDNLEWCGYQRNNNHAYQTGLRSDNRRLKCKDLKDGTVYHFYSLAEASRFLGCRQSSVHYWLSSEKPKVVAEKYVIVDEDNEFPDLTMKDAPKSTKMGYLRSYTITNEETREKKHFPNSQAMADFLKVHERTARRYLNSDKLLKGWKIENITDENVYKTFCEDWANSRDFSYRKPLPIEVIDTVTMEKTFYKDGVHEFANKIGCVKSTIQRGMSVNGFNEEGYGRWKTYLIRYLPNK